MEEVDSIILHFLRQLNINIEQDVKSICDLPVETIIEAVSTCLVTINSQFKIPRKLPFGISQRIEVATQIASCCKDIGYKNDVGYQTFLYYNESELRQVFMFLIERLPNEGKIVTSAAPSSERSLLMRDISNKINDELKNIWIPPCCTPTPKKIGDFCSLDLKAGVKLIRNEEEIIKKLMNTKKTNKIQSNVTTQIINNELTEPVPNIAVKVEITKTLKELKEIALVLRQKLDTLESERNVMDVEFSQALRSCERVDTDLKNVDNILQNIGISADMEESDSLLDRMQENINILHGKSEELMSKNLSLKVEIEKTKYDISGSERSKCKKILMNLKESAKALKDEYDKKDILKKQLKENYEKLKGGNKRSIYTKRILEIISNVDKQNIEIKKILEDTRQLQKEINTLEGQLDRCFSIADETLFKDAKKDDQAKKAYKLLALLHSECNTIVSLVNEMGSLARDVVELEENIKTESAKRTEDTLRKIKHDFTKMKEEQ